MAYNICKIKNISGVQKTLRGKQFSIDEDYQIQDEERSSWMHDDDVIVAISDEDFQIYDSSGAISGIADQLNWLHDRSPISAITEYTYAYSLMADAVSGDCSANDSADIDLKIVNQPGESYEYKYLWGGNVFVKDAEYGDWVEFQIVDKDGVYYPAGTVMKKYILKQYINPNEQSCCKTESPGKVPVNVYIRAIYHATGSGSTRTAFFNFQIHNKD